MKRVMMILATVALASTVAIGAADARGGGGGGGGHGGFGGGGFGGGAHIGGFGGGAHIDGIVSGSHLGGFRGGAGAPLRVPFGGAHVGGTAAPGRMAGINGDHLGVDDRSHPYGDGIHYHAIHHYGRYRSGYAYYDNPDCYNWELLHPDQPLPLSCS
jgi:hypothetical protein